jgi:two-component system, chemotaxis family, protein-glutamate methylesterase/glutaminase
LTQPQRRARVLIVDDSVVVRSLVSRLLGEDPELQVVGTSANGRLALRRLQQRDVDVVVLDIDMPELDGLATLRALKRDFPGVAVIMFSTHTEAGAVATIESLSIGAHDYVTKPSTLGNLEQTSAAVRDELERKIKVACFGELLKTPSVLPYTPAPAPPRSGPTPSVDIVAIGASTGGPNALTQILSDLPEHFPVPIVVVQHMPPMFTKIFAERLDTLCRLAVREAVHGGALEPGAVWIAQGGTHMTVTREPHPVVRINHDPPVNYCRPAVDVLFHSVASAYGPRALGVVLTGMGHDGLRGSEHIRNLGGRVFAQDQASSVVWGMPGYVARANLANRVLPLGAVADTLWSSVMGGRAALAALDGAIALGAPGGGG